VDALYLSSSLWKIERRNRWLRYIREANAPSVGVLMRLGGSNFPRTQAIKAYGEAVGLAKAMVEPSTCEFPWWPVAATVSAHPPASIAIESEVGLAVSAAGVSVAQFASLLKTFRNRRSHQTSSVSVSPEITAIPSHSEGYAVPRLDCAVLRCEHPFVVRPHSVTSKSCGLPLHLPWVRSHSSSKMQIQLRPRVRMERAWTCASLCGDAQRSADEFLRAAIGSREQKDTCEVAPFPRYVIRYKHRLSFSIPGGFRLDATRVCSRIVARPVGTYLDVRSLGSGYPPYLPTIGDHHDTTQGRNSPRGDLSFEIELEDDLLRERPSSINANTRAAETVIAAEAIARMWLREMEHHIVRVT
jgi:hypothetical protein